MAFRPLADRFENDRTSLSVYKDFVAVEYKDFVAVEPKFLRGSRTAWLLPVEKRLAVLRLLDALAMTATNDSYQ